QHTAASQPASLSLHDALPISLVLLRHGESTWNLENLFTGWTDVPLSERGVQEAVEAGRLMRDAGLRPSVVHESLLLRAIQTTQLDRKSTRLNSSHVAISYAVF